MILERLAIEAFGKTVNDVRSVSEDRIHLDQRRVCRYQSPDFRPIDHERGKADLLLKKGVKGVFCVGPYVSPDSGQVPLRVHVD